MRVVSLFSGAGGLDLGLELAGHHIVWANDCDPDCVRTYRRNLSDVIDGRPIESVPLAEIPDADVVVGGFPCQGFSLANRLRDVGDERNRLYRQFIRVLQHVRPRYFIAENVRGILSLGGGQVVDRILAEFHRAGYLVTYRVLNAADYGVPQTRQRVIFLGTRREMGADGILSFPQTTHSNPSKLVKGLAPWVSIADALRGIPEPEDPHSLANHVCSAYKVTNRNFTGHRRTDPDRPSPTILARGNGGGGVCAIQHPRNHRRLSVRESALIQTFPLEFVFEGKLNSMYRQVGNAVPVLLAKRLGEALSAAAASRGNYRCA